MENIKIYTAVIYTENYEGDYCRGLLVGGWYGSDIEFISTTDLKDFISMTVEALLRSPSPSPEITIMINGICDYTDFNGSESYGAYQELYSEISEIHRKIEDKKVFEKAERERISKERQEAESAEKAAKAREIQIQNELKQLAELKQKYES